MEKVKVEDAARELGLTPVCLRELLIREKIPIGYGYQKDGCGKRKFVIYRGLLDSYKRTLEGGES